MLRNARHYESLPSLRFLFCWCFSFHISFAIWRHSYVLFIRNIWPLPLSDYSMVQNAGRHSIRPCVLLGVISFQMYIDNLQLLSAISLSHNVIKLFGKSLNVLFVLRAVCEVRAQRQNKVPNQSLFGFVAYVSFLCLSIHLIPCRTLRSDLYLSIYFHLSIVLALPERTFHR